MTISRAQPSIRNISNAGTPWSLTVALATVVAMAREIRKAILLAAGRGTRLGALTQSQPKPLLEIAGKPLIAHIVDGLATANLRDIAIVTGYLAALIEAWCLARNRAG